MNRHRAARNRACPGFSRLFCSSRSPRVVILFLNVGRWLVVEDPLEKANAIVVLSGRLPMRALEAARLYQVGLGTASLAHASQTNRPLRSPSLDIDDPGEDAFSARVLQHGGVSPADIHTLTPPITIPPTKSARSRPKPKSKTPPL